MDKTSKAYKIAKEQMLDHDPFSQWLGIEILEIEDGYCKVALTVRKEMVNGMNIAHGGITYSLSDSAFAFASNSHGKLAVSIETSITHSQAVHIGDRLTATATIEHKNHKIGTYHVKVLNQNDEIVALFKGTVYRKSTDWEITS